MTTLQATLSPRLHAVDLCYWLDNEEECFLLPTDVAVWARYFCPAAMFSRLVEPEQLEGNVRNLVIDTRRRVESAFDSWLRGPNTPPEHKIICLALGLRRIPKMLAELGHKIAEWTIIEHNELLFYRNKPDHRATKKLKTIKQWRPKTSEGHFNIDVFDWSPFRDDETAKDAVTSISRQMARVEELRQHFPDVLQVKHRLAILENRLETRHLHKIVRRGIELLSDLIGYDQTREFVSQGEPLLIEGTNVAFRLLVESVMQPSSHGSMTTEVIVEGKSVCNLCIYTPDTPPLDHVASLIAHVRAGLEEDIISAGNVFSVREYEPTGVATLDAKIQALSRKQRVVVRSVHPPVIGEPEPIEIDLDDHDMIMEVIRIGESYLLSRLTRQRANRIAGYFYQRTLGNFKFPRFQTIEG